MITGCCGSADATVEVSLVRREDGTRAGKQGLSLTGERCGASVSLDASQQLELMQQVIEMIEQSQELA